MSGKGKIILLVLILLVAGMNLGIEKYSVYADNPPTQTPEPNPAHSDVQGTPGSSVAQTARARVCQSHQLVLKNLFTHLFNQATSAEAKIDAIAGRVQQYYTLNLVPVGKTLSTYDALLADMQVQRNAVQTYLTAAENDVTNFNCLNVNHKSHLSQFSHDMHALIHALKDYKASVKKFVSGIQSVAGQTSVTGQ
jgi:hypothetical protein